MPLHGGYAPPWLVKRMTSLARNIILIMVDEHGQSSVLKRLSDPFWFQALGCVLGFDWHSSGVTTVVTGVLKKAIDPTATGIALCGGKGKRSKLAPSEIRIAAELFGLSTSKSEHLVYASRMGAKVDNAAIQAGYPLYHHAFILTERGDWAIVQQGFNPEKRLARRYHWISEGLKDFVVEPHTAIVGRKEPSVFNMTANEADSCRKVSVDLVRDNPAKLKREIVTIKEKNQRVLTDWCGGRTLVMPWNINWKALDLAYNSQPRNYEELLSIEGIGPATVKGLSLISDLIYGEPPSWRDPVRYSFAFGGKDGVPFPVRRKEMDEATEYLRLAIEGSKVEEKERIAALKRLRDFSSNAP